jgi:hypothetical protein
MRPQKIISGTFYIEHFDTTFINPLVEIRAITIPMPVNKIDIAIALKSQDESTTFHYYVLKDIQVSNLNYEGEANLFERVEQGLQKYIPLPKN